MVRVLKIIDSWLLPGLMVLASMLVVVVGHQTKTTVIEPWVVPVDGQPYSTQRVHIGDTIIWSWSVPGLNAISQPRHSVNYHPNGGCGQEGRVRISPGQGSIGPAAYTFTAEDSGKAMLFSCDIGNNCLDGQRMLVEVLGQPTIAPAPTKLPTQAPSKPLTKDPTVSPTPRATTNPTNRPPTPPPSPRPISPTPLVQETPQPTRNRSSSPTTNPTMVPIKEPTIAPTRRLTEDPTVPPIGDPTLHPTPITTTVEPIPNPTMSPLTMTSTFPPASLSGGVQEREENSAPTAAPMNTQVATLDVLAALVISVFIPNGRQEYILLSAYEFELVDTLDLLVREVVANPVPSERWLLSANRALQDQRIQPSVKIERIRDVGFTSDPQLSEEGRLVSGACPAVVGNAQVDRCEQITASIIVSVQNNDSQDLAELQQALQAGLLAATGKGRLQSLLFEGYPKPTISILTGQMDPFIVPSPASDEPTTDSPTNPPPSDAVEAPPINLDNPTFGGLTIAALAGIAVGAGMFLALCACLLLRYCFHSRRQSRQREPNPEQAPSSDVEKASIGVDTVPATGLEWGEYDGYNDDRSASIPSTVMDPRTLPLHMVDDGSTWTTTTEEDRSYRRPDGVAQGPINMHTTTPLKEELSHVLEEVTTEEQSLGNVSHDSSGMYSSSMGTVESEDIMNGARVVVDLGAQGQNLREYTPGIANLDDLEAAIMAGDWAALGATASSLADHDQDSVGSSEQPSTALSKASTNCDEFSRDWSIRSKGWQDVIDATKAAELDQLVEQGNWAAILDAARRYQTEATGLPTVHESENRASV